MLGLSLIFAAGAIVAAVRPHSRWGEGPVAGLVPFALGSLATAVAMLALASMGSGWLAPGLLLVGWVTLRVLTRPGRTRRHRTIGAVVTLGAVLAATATVVFVPEL
jgi:hypothetical protein